VPKILSDSDAGDGIAVIPLSAGIQNLTHTRTGSTEGVNGNPREKSEKF
jgi:hypothetical protein